MKTYHNNYVFIQILGYISGQQPGFFLREGAIQWGYEPNEAKDLGRYVR